MGTLMLKIRGSALLGALALSCMTLSATAEELNPLKWRSYSNKDAGFSIVIPAEWYDIQAAGPEVHEVYLSREEVRKAGDLYTFGAYVWRIKGWKKYLSLSTKDPDQARLEFANRIGAGLADGGNAVVIAAGSEDYGMELQYFQIIATDKNGVCTNARLLVGIDGKEWFHLLIEIPCQEVDANKDVLARIRESIRVNPTWRLGK